MPDAQVSTQLNKSIAPACSDLSIYLLVKMNDTTGILYF